MQKGKPTYYDIGLFLGLVSGLFSIPPSALCYPEMVRHGYVNCISCHVSPTGGGILTPYGRELSKEILSTWSKEGEQEFLYGALSGRPEWINLGGDFRNLVLYRDTTVIKEGSIIQMQLDLEVAVSVSRFTFVSTAGYKAPPPSNPNDTERLISRRHYINYGSTDGLSFRAGKFLSAFGINTPDHAIVTKRGLNWDQGSETYNLENAWAGEKVSVFLTAIFGRPDQTMLKREKGGTATASYSILDKYKMGGSYFYGMNDLGKRHTYGPWGILGITEKATVLIEFDLQNHSMTGTAESKNGFVSYNKFDYEFIKGLHSFLTQEFQNLDVSRSNQLTRVTGIGIQFFPRPHLDLNLSYQRYSLGGNSDPTHLLFFLFHLYL